mgnify:FL=1
MFILFLVMALIAFIVSVRLVFKYKKSIKERGDFFGIVFFITLCSVVVFFILGANIYDLAKTIASESVIDHKIEMYQEENTKIEQEVDNLVKEYIDHEHDTFAELKEEKNAITLVTLFPELKSDSLVKQQIEIHVKNNTKIKKLKEEKIDISLAKWKLYFGK